MGGEINANENCVFYVKGTYFLRIRMGEKAVVKPREEECGENYGLDLTKENGMRGIVVGQRHVFFLVGWRWSGNWEREDLRNVVETDRRLQ